MAGITFAGSVGGTIGTPVIRKYLLPNSLTIYAGDLVVLTTKASLTASGAVVVRTLLDADRAAVYAEGGNTVGVLGISFYDVTTNSSGQSTSPAALGGVASGGQVVFPYGGPGLLGLDRVTSRQYLPVMVATSDMVFRGKLDALSPNSTHALDNTLAGLKLVGTAPTAFSIDTTAATKVLKIIAPDEQDPLYNASLGNVFFQFTETYQQYLTGFNYSTN